jgi:orotate phosphoribosyltransferase
MQEKVLELLSGRRGHFLLESGHHGDLWLDLESLCLRPRATQSLAAELATSLSQLEIDAVCGPLVEGAFVALMTASHLDVEFTYSERYTRKTADGLFPSGYRIPRPLRDGLRGKRVAIVDDVINAGSAVRGTFFDLEECGANVVAINTLLVLGSAADQFAASKNVPLNSLAKLPNALWAPSECQLCASGAALEDVASFSTAVLS